MKHNQYITLDRLVLVVIILVLLFINKCKNRDYQAQTSTIDSLTLSKQISDSLLNTKGEEIRLQQTIVTEQQETINELADSIFALRKKDQKNRETIAWYQGRTTTGLGGVFIPYDSTKVDTTPSKVEVDTGTYWVPYYPDEDTLRAKQNTPYYNIDIGVTGRGVLVNDISFPDTLNLRFVEHKGSLFRRKSLEIQYFHSNPYVRDLGSNSVIYKPKQKGRWVERALLIAAGIFVGIKL